LFAEFTLFYYVFLQAYMNPAKRIGIDVNAFGEANLELIIFTLLLALGTVEVFLTFREMRG